VAEGSTTTEDAGLDEAFSEFDQVEAEVDETVDETPAAESEETQAEETVDETVEEELPTDSKNPNFNKALQKVQQEIAPLRRENEALKARLDAIEARGTQQSPKATETEPEVDPVAEAMTEIDALEKMDNDDLITGKQVGGALKKVLSGMKTALAAKDAKIAALEGRTAADTGELRFERKWKAENAVIADQYETLLQQTHEYVQKKYPHFKPGSDAYTGAWHAAHDAKVESAKAAKTAKAVVPDKAKVIAKPSQAPRKPVPPGLKPGKSGPASSVQTDKFNTDSDNPMDWFTPGTPVGL
jgi:hypothetical protein